MNGHTVFVYAAEAFQGYVITVLNTFQPDGVSHTVKPVLSGQSKTTKNWFSRPVIAKCMSKVLQNAPKGAFCNTFDLN